MKRLNTGLANTRFVTGFLAVILFLGVGVAQGKAAPPEQEVGQSHLHHFVQGTIARKEGGVVFIKTDEGSTRTVSLKELQSELSGEFKKGDRVRLEVDEGNQIIDIDRVTTGVFHPETHATVTGKIERFNRAGKTVVLTLEDGRRLSYDLKDPAAAKLAMVKDGSRVELTLDEESGLVNDVLVR